MMSNKLTDALARVEWEWKTSGHGAVGMLVDVKTLQEMMGIILECDKRMRDGDTFAGEGWRELEIRILHIAKEMRKARRDWKRELEEAQQRARDEEHRPDLRKPKRSRKKVKT